MSYSLPLVQLQRKKGPASLAGVFVFLVLVPVLGVGKPKEHRSHFGPFDGGKKKHKKEERGTHTDIIPM